MSYWLMKSEPDLYSIDDLESEGSCYWEGVRNYQARNFMRDKMKVGDSVLFYHSNAKPSGVVGVAEVCKESYPDFTAWELESSYYDRRSSKEKPIWVMVDLAFKEKFTRTISLAEIKKNVFLHGMLLVKKGMRLSVQPVTEEEFEYICKLGRDKC